MILGVDPGEARVGIAVADDETRWARPLEVVDTRSRDAIARIAELVTELGAGRVVVGLPLSLSGAEGPAARKQRAFVAALRDSLEVEVVEFDERLTTVIAERSLRSAGAKGPARRRLRDAVAAQVMLQGYLDAQAR